MGEWRETVATRVQLVGCLYCAALARTRDDDEVLQLRPGALVDVGVQVVVPPLSALLAHTTREALRDGGPPLRLPAHLFYQLDDHGILLRTVTGGNRGGISGGACCWTMCWGLVMSDRRAAAARLIQ